MRWFLSSELGTNCIEWANVLRLIFLWYALKAIMSQSYFNGPTTRSLNLQILYFSFLPVMEPLRAGWLFFLHTAATHCFTVVFSLSFQQFPFSSPLFSPALAQLMSCFQGSHWDTGDRYTWCTGSGQRGEGCVPNWGMTCKYQWSVAQTLYLCVKVMGMQRIFVWMHESYILMLHLTTTVNAWNYFCDTCIKSVDKLDRLVGSDLCGWKQMFPANTKPFQWENKRRGRAVGKRRRQHGRVSACLPLSLFCSASFF